MNLKNQTIAGVAWTLGQQVGVQGINFVVQIILARLLVPADFGLIAMVQIFLTIGAALMDGGMTSSLIRTKNADNRDYSTVFYMNLGVSILIYALVFLGAPLMASFFDQPVLTPLIRVYTISFVIQALVGVQTTKLTKEMNFKLQMLMQIPSTIIGGIVGVVLAFKGSGVWSLVWMQLVISFLFMVQHWIWSDWKPTLLFDKDKLKEHFGFGYKLTLSTLLTTLYSESYTIIIGKFFPASQLGFYRQAKILSMFPVSNLTKALQKVTYPVFSKLQDDNVKLRNSFKKITSVVFFVVTPVMLFLALEAKPIINLLLTDKWLPAVPFFQILCIFSLFYPLSMYNLNIILAKGRSDLHFKLEVLKKSLSVVVLLGSLFFGITGIVIASGISMLIHAVVNSTASGKLIGYPLIQQFKHFSPILLIGIVTSLIVKAISAFLKKQVGFFDKDLFDIITSLLFFIIIYFFLNKLFKITALEETRKLKKYFLQREKRSKEL